MTLVLFKDWVQWHGLSQCSRVPADQMHLQSLKVMFLEETCMKIPVKAHKPWFIYMGISKYKSESVHKHWSFHTYMQAKYTKSNTFSERDLCKNMYSNCRPPSRHTKQSMSTLLLLAKYFYSINWKIYQKVRTNNSARKLTSWSINHISKGSEEQSADKVFLCWLWII